MIVALRPDAKEWGFTPGVPYSVLEIEGDDLRLVDDEGGAYLWPRRLISVTNPSVSPDWEISWIAVGGRRMCIGSSGISGMGYFEDVHDRSPGSEGAVFDTLAITKEEKSRFAAWFNSQPWAPAFRAVELGIFANTQEAVSVLLHLRTSVCEQGVPVGCIGGGRPGKVLVPVGNGGVAHFLVWKHPSVIGIQVTLEGVGTWEDWERRHRGESHCSDGSIDDLGRNDPGVVARASDAEAEAWQHAVTRTMRVRLKPDRRSPSLTPGRVYSVLEVVGVKFRVISDGGGPKLFRFDAFVVVDPIVAPEWQVHFGRRGHIRLTTQSFATPLYFDRVAAREPESELSVVGFRGLLAEEQERFSTWFGEPR